MLQIERGSMFVNRAQQSRIRYRYQDHLGQIHEGLSGFLPPDAAATWRTDDKGEVRFDRLRPQDSVWVGKPREERNGFNGKEGNARDQTIVRRVLCMCCN